MAKSYYSTVFDQPAGAVWTVIRDFNSYPVWVEGSGTSEIEDGKSGDTVGAVRSAHFNGRHVRQELPAHSDIERAMSCRFAGVSPLPVQDFQATIRITPVRRQSRFCRMVGDIRLRQRRARRAGRLLARRLRRLARIAAAAPQPAGRRGAAGGARGLAQTPLVISRNLNF